MCFVASLGLARAAELAAVRGVPEVTAGDRKITLAELKEVEHWRFVAARDPKLYEQQAARDKAMAQLMADASRLEIDLTEGMTELDRSATPPSFGLVKELEHWTWLKQKNPEVYQQVIARNPQIG